ncbi:hypothetical protein DIPPA_11853 [Diplonema papillatum]|nr:hypothetical protein DIPPA_11853 [Diplonema papillatum]
MVKKGAKKAGGGGGTAAVNLFSDRPPMTPADVQRIADRWVSVQMRLVTWNYLDFIIRVPSSTNLYIIEQQIKEQHCGSITKLQLWKTLVHPKNVLKDFSRTLAEEFRLDDYSPDEEVTTGVCDTDKDPDCVIFYDFHPHESDCPLLLCSPRNNESTPAPLPPQPKMTR